MEYIRTVVKVGSREVFDDDFVSPHDDRVPFRGPRTFDRDDHMSLQS